MTELPCNKCNCDYGGYQPNWCPCLGKVINSVNDIPHYFARIPAFGKNEDRCLGFMVQS